jgi:hypothetical protein
MDNSQQHLMNNPILVEVASNNTKKFPDMWSPVEADGIKSTIKRILVISLTIVENEQRKSTHL